MNVMPPPFGVAVAWHSETQKDEFLAAWNIQKIPDWLFLERDIDKSGCAVVKNRAIRRAYDSGAEVIVVVDDDIYPPPAPDGRGPLMGYTLADFADDHITALKPQPVRMIYATGKPQPRGMPFRQRHITMPVAAAMGFWLQNPDFDAISSLVLGPNATMEVAQVAMFRHFFPLCGMNYSFRREWIDCALQVEGCNRWEDIFAGYAWEKVAYERGFCFNLCGPVVTHYRQSEVWANFRDEAKYLELNETLWQAIYAAPAGLAISQLRDYFFPPGLTPEILAEKIQNGYTSPADR